MTHHSTRWTALLALALGSFTVSARASAQVAVVSRTSLDDAVHVTFGQLCEDRFVIRNDGAKPVDLEYAVEKGTEHTKLTLNARELVELESKAKEPLELWIGGKLVAKAVKEKRACKDVQGNATVLVAPLEVAATVKEDRNSSANAYARGYPYYDPFMYGGAFGYGYGGYGGFGFRPFYSGFVGVPIIVSGGSRGGGGRRR